MRASRTIFIDYNDLTRIAEKIKKGEYDSLNHFLKAAIKKELKGEKNEQFRK